MGGQLIRNYSSDIGRSITARVCIYTYGQQWRTRYRRTERKSEPSRESEPLIRQLSRRTTFSPARASLAYIYATLSLCTYTYIYICAPACMYTRHSRPNRIGQSTRRSVCIYCRARMSLARAFSPIVPPSRVYDAFNDIRASSERFSRKTRGPAFPSRRSRRRDSIRVYACVSVYIADS